jgi:hypothetical protein
MDLTNLNKIVTHSQPGLDPMKDAMRRAAERFESPGQPTQEELMMDGTYLMYLRSRSSSSTCSKLAIALPNPGDAATHQQQDQNQQQPLKFQTCRQCTGSFTYKLRSGGTVTILAGIPAPNAIYKAMSYVWGPVVPLPLACERCGHVSSTPVMNSQRFENLMEQGGNGETIWLDALSIDQSNPAEIAVAIACMGTIYSRAQYVSVLLPADDFPVYDCLSHASMNAIGILYCTRNFIDNVEFEISDPTGEQPGRIKCLQEWSKLFLENLKRVKENFHRYAYWRRAWTFQERVLARDLQIAVEGGPAEAISAVKSLINGAGMLLARYMMLLYQYAAINTGLSRGTVLTVWNGIQNIFPYEDINLYYEEVDIEERSFQTKFPNFGLNQLLGVRDFPMGSSLEPRQDEYARFRARLVLLLSSFASSHHEAKHEADLVACWAGMCDLQYNYDKNDDFDTALQKALATVRAKGVAVYHFLPATTGGSHKSYDSFRDYARAHVQHQTSNQSISLGPPIFTGEADTLVHMGHSVLKVDIPTQWIRSSNNLTVVSYGEVAEMIQLDDIDAAVAGFEKIVYGYLIEMPLMTLYFNAGSLVKKALELVSSEKREAARLCLVRVPFRMEADLESSDNYIHAWAIVPSDIQQSELIVAREAMNGTLVLATRRESNYFIAAYLTLTDHLCGTFLVNTDSSGYCDIVLKRPERSDRSHSGYERMGERRIRGSIPL